MAHMSDKCGANAFAPAQSISAALDRLHMQSISAALDICYSQTAVIINILDELQRQLLDLGLIID